MTWRKSLFFAVLPTFALLGLWLGASALRAATTPLKPPSPALQFDTPPFPAEVAKPFSFGLSSLVADLTFIEAIQIFGGRSKNPQTADEGANEDRLLARLVAYSVDLDPKFRGAYRFAGNALPRHTLDGKAANVLAAEHILRKGVRERGDDWRTVFLLGFIESYYLAHYREAAEHMALAAKAPDAPRYLGLLATRLAASGGDLAFAESVTTAALAQSGEQEGRADWEARLKDVRMERDLAALRTAVAAYSQRTGRAPPGLKALLASGDLASVPAEPHGAQYQLTPKGEVRSTAAVASLRVREDTLSGLEAR
jgi:hypothetical protein